jgi:hypothetical protein
MLRKLTLFRACLLGALASLIVGVHHVVRLFWLRDFMYPPTLVGAVEDFLVRPAWLMAIVVLPTPYAYIICESAPPSDIGWVTGPTVVFFNMFFWTTVVAFFYGIVYWLRRAMYVQRI